MLEPRLILVNLLIKLGVAAALSSALVRSMEFKRLLFREQRSTRQKIYLALWMAIPIGPGGFIRDSSRFLPHSPTNAEIEGSLKALTRTQGERQ